MHLAKFEGRIYNKSLSALSEDKMLISCLNAHSFNILQSDKLYESAILKSQVVLPDGIAIVYALRFLTGAKLRKISGHMLFDHEMKKLNLSKGRCFFLGSCIETNNLIKARINREYPNITVDSYSPPYKKEFNKEDNQIMISKINFFQPDVLFIGMTAPKQEKWASAHFDDLSVKHICCIGAVFDFYAYPNRNPPGWMINIGLEWLYRLIREPKRLWRRYLYGNPKFIGLILKEKFTFNGKTLAKSVEFDRINDLDKDLEFPN
jgi:N-acetylglucosaminyldiphosphoundecaprenol N-acetyl-beta-D-mannosaminyltransferase